ncbi:MAG: LuxR family transcriptional regulator [Lentimicrobiaceae bacterium]|nr:LuxR family transcriptional regulator [Lentimicrobiaceae bacterium]
MDRLFQQYWELLDQQHFIEADLDYSIVDEYITFLHQLDQLGNSAISIFDLFKRDHVFISGNYASIFGYDLEEAEKEGWRFFDKDYHPDDLRDLMKASIYFIKMGFDLDRKLVKDYKLIYDYRRKNKWGDYIRVVEQQKVIELDVHNNVWLALSILDISPDKDILTPFRCRLVNVKTAELFHFPLEDELPRLSYREKEILDLISRGLISKQIADKLYISVNTVNTHRQRIIEKLNVSNTAEAIQYASRLGLQNKN